jgi:hypothetical protein
MYVILSSLKANSYYVQSTYNSRRERGTSLFYWELLMREIPLFIRDIYEEYFFKGYLAL